jgi:hypothetical protein
MSTTLGKRGYFKELIMSAISEEKISRLVYQGPYRFLTTIPSRGIQTYRVPFRKAFLPTDVVKPHSSDRGGAAPSPVSGGKPDGKTR